MTDKPLQLTPEALPRRDLWALWAASSGLALALVASAELVCSWIPSSEQEGVILRWVRVAVDHPVRTGLALSLAATALRGSRRKRATSEVPPPW